MLTSGALHFFVPLHPTPLFFPPTIRSLSWEPRDSRRFLFLRRRLSLGVLPRVVARRWRLPWSTRVPSRPLSSWTCPSTKNSTWREALRRHHGGMGQRLTLLRQGEGRTTRGRSGEEGRFVQEKGSSWLPRVSDGIFSQRYFVLVRRSSSERNTAHVWNGSCTHRCVCQRKSVSKNNSATLSLHP